MSGKNAREERKEILEKLQKEQKKEANRGRNLIIAGFGAFILVLVVIAAVFINGNSNSSGLEEVPPSAVALGEPTVLNPDAPDNIPVLDIYEDFQCPFCGSFETTLGSGINDLADEGKIKVQIHTLTFLDANLGNSASRKAARGALAADEQGKFSEFHSIVYRNQPAQEGKGWTDAELLTFAELAGVEDLDAWKASLASDKFDTHIKAVQTKANDSGITGTPTVKLNGVVVTDQVTSIEALTTLIDEAANNETVPSDSTDSTDATDEETSSIN